MVELVTHMDMDMDILMDIMPAIQDTMVVTQGMVMDTQVMDTQVTDQLGNRVFHQLEKSWTN